MSRRREACLDRRLRIFGSLALLALVPAAARAHLASSGMGPFYDGVLHLLISPLELLGLATLTLLAGLCGRRAGRLAVLALPAAWLVGGLVGLALAVEISLPWWSALSLVVLGGLVALDVDLAPGIVGCLAAAYGAVAGLLDGAALESAGEGWVALLGSSVAVSLIVLLLLAAVVSLAAAWMRIAVRVAGSWMAALGLLMLGWLMRGDG
ncbi:MAG: HupE/UreJ family protein [Thermoanaerobaculia bacterium]|nr:HupE/UreJ family protein [Thermoanaerobaculia bacterium]